MNSFPLAPLSTTETPSASQVLIDEFFQSFPKDLGTAMHDHFDSKPLFQFEYTLEMIEMVQHQLRKAFGYHFNMRIVNAQRLNRSLITEWAMFKSFWWDTLLDCEVTADPEVNHRLSVCRARIFTLSRLCVLFGRDSLMRVIEDGTRCLLAPRLRVTQDYIPPFQRHPTLTNLECLRAVKNTYVLPLAVPCADWVLVYTYHPGCACKTLILGQEVRGYCGLMPMSCLDPREDDSSVELSYSANTYRFGISSPIWIWSYLGNLVYAQANLGADLMETDDSDDSDAHDVKEEPCADSTPAPANFFGLDPEQLRAVKIAYASD